MARIRTVKPELYQHEILGKLSPLHRILFTGLFNQADREGRLQDRPDRIKLAVLPYDNCDINKLLNELSKTIDPDDGLPFIVRYDIKGMRYIQITNFTKHQRPHVREPASQIPPPPEHCLGNGKALPKHCLAPVQHAGKGKEREGK